MVRPMGQTGDAVVEVVNLRVGYPSRGRTTHWVLHTPSLTIRRGEIVGIIGRSGSGKTSLCRAMLGLLRPPAAVSGDVRWPGWEHSNRLAARRWIANNTGYVPQNPSTALHPMIRVGSYMSEIIKAKLKVNHRLAFEQARDLLNMIGFTDVERVLASYPNMLSAGMKQRVLIGLALVGNPFLLVLDEPTAANDSLATYKCACILDRYRSERSGIMVASHDLKFIETVSDRIVFIDEGQLKEVVQHAALGHAGTSTFAYLVDSYRKLHPERSKRGGN